MDKMDPDLQELIQSYFDCGWEEYENDPRVKETVAEMKELSDTYLKVKSSKSGDNMVATLAMESELKRLSGELRKTVNKLKLENEDQELEMSNTDEAVETETESEEVKPTKKKSTNLSTIAVGISFLALIVGGASVFLSGSNNVSKEEFETYKSSVIKSVMKEVQDENRTMRADVEAFRTEMAALKQEVESTKLILSANQEEFSDKLAAQASELNSKLVVLQASLKRSSGPAKKLTAPSLKSKTPIAPSRKKATKR